MTMFAGLSQLGQSMSSQAASAYQSQSSTISSNTAGSPLIGIPAGGSGNNTTSGTFRDSIYVQPLAPVGDMLTLIKTAEGEFVLNGTGNTLKLLMDYFLQSPEMWLRLAALSSKEEG